MGRHVRSDGAEAGAEAGAGSAQQPGGAVPRNRSLLLRAGLAALVLSLVVSGGAYAVVRATTGGEPAVQEVGVPLGAEGSGVQGGVTVAEGADAQVETVTEDVTEPRGTVEKPSADLAEGETRVETEGADGVVRTTYLVTTVDGQEVSRQPVSTVVVSEKQDRVVLVGTGTAEESAGSGDSGSGEASQGTGPDAAGSSAGEGSGETGGGSAGEGTGGGSADPEDDAVWAALAQCESGGDPTANTGNGYYGLYQFSLSTWQAYGGTGLPSEASAAEQTAVAKRLQAAAGWGQWPHCAAQLGLL